MKSGRAVDNRGMTLPAENHPQVIPGLPGGFTPALLAHLFVLKQRLAIDIPGFSLLQHHRL
jgi:hypothetical protein